MFCNYCSGQGHAMNLNTHNLETCPVCKGKGTV